MIAFIVALEGITQVISYRPLKISSKEEIKLQGYKILEKLRLTQSVPAAGVMFAKKQYGIISIDPVVWVRDIQTLFYETACASGTTAIALAETIRLERKSRAEFSVLQPSKTFKSPHSIKNGVPDYAEIGGAIKILKKTYPLSYENQHRTNFAIIS